MNWLKTKRFGRRHAAAGTARRERGFTLIETSIAIVIMMVTGLGAISLFFYSTNYGAGASDRARAFALAQQRMETLRNTPYASLNSTLATANTGAVTLGAASSGDPRTFNVTTTIVDDPNTRITATRQKIITVTVTPAANGRWSSGAVTLTTYRTSITRGTN